MASVDTRAKYKAALEIIARSECAHPEEVAAEAIHKRPIKRLLKRNMILVGDRFGRLEAIMDCGLLKVSHLPKHPRRGDHVWLCWCDCGRLHFAKARSLVADTTRSCGCLRSEMSTVAARIGSFNRGSEFPTRLHRAIEKLRKRARLRPGEGKKKREKEAREVLEATKRKLIPYAGYDPSGTKAVTDHNNGWKVKLGLDRV